MNKIILLIALALTGCSAAIDIPSTPLPLPTETAQTAQPTETHTETCTVNGDKVYMRAGAGMNYEPIAVLRHGQVLNVIESGDWLNVSTGTYTGFVYGRYCR